MAIAVFNAMPNYQTLVRSTDAINLDPCCSDGNALSIHSIFAYSRIVLHVHFDSEVPLVYGTFRISRGHAGKPDN